MFEQHTRGTSSAYTFPPLVRSMRPRQWLKNLLIFVPMAAGHQFSGPTWIAALTAFAAFCMCASSAYLLNDVLDAGHDRLHPSKRHRPVAAGLVSTGQASRCSALLGLSGLLAAALYNVALLQVVGAYFLLTIVYSMRLKKILLIDVTTLSILYGIRIVGGAAATGITLSFWLMSFSFFVFLSLALLKRHNELLRLASGSHQSVPGRGYIPNDKTPVAVFGICAAMLSAIILLLYYNSGSTAALYPSPLLLVGVVPLFFIWIARLWVLSFRGAIEEDPLLHVSTDPPSLVLIALCMSLALLASR